MSHHGLAIALPLTALLAVSLARAGSISYQITDVFPGAGAALSPPGAVIERYTYYANDITFLANQELDIEFSAGLYGVISNGQITPGFDLTLFQPNNPPGAPGLFSAFALQDVGPAEGPWSVEFTFLGPSRPGSQTFSINQFDGNGQFITTLETGSTVPAGSASDAPEPGTFGFMGLVIVCGVVWWAVPRPKAETPNTV